MCRTRELFIENISYLCLTVDKLCPLRPCENGLGNKIQSESEDLSTLWQFKQQKASRKNYKHWYAAVRNSELAWSRDHLTRRPPQSTRFHLPNEHEIFKRAKLLMKYFRYTSLSFRFFTTFFFINEVYCIFTMQNFKEHKCEVNTNKITSCQFGSWKQVLTFKRLKRRK